MRDAEGAPDQDGRRYHAAKDVFDRLGAGAGGAGSPVLAPATGKVVEVRPSRGDAGQVFGGVVKIDTSGSRDGGGLIYVMRHVEPLVTNGQRVAGGTPVARVTRWRDWPKGSHVHLECWRRLVVPGVGTGYYLPNMVDPMTLAWRSPSGIPADPVLPLDELPHGDTLRIAIGDRRWSGWQECAGALRWIAVHAIRDDDCAIAWRGTIWRGRRDVTAVARNLARRYL